MRNFKIGTLSIKEAVTKIPFGSSLSSGVNAHNNITMRSVMLVEQLNSKQPSTSVEDAQRKALRLYRRFCRLIPFIIRNNYMQYKTTPALAKQQLATNFRQFARLTDLVKLDMAIAEGYQQMLTLEQVYTEPAGSFNELAPKQKHRDMGYSFYQQRFNNKGKPASKFLTGFYNLRKDPDS